MAKVKLRTLWLNLAATPEVRQSFPHMASLQVNTARKGEVRTYTTGRMRSITKVGRAHTLTASLPACTREQIDWLAKHQGELLCVRDDRGRKFWAVFFDLPVEEHPYNQEANVSLILNEVTHSEAV
ncbi:hypothetical protein [Kineococcus radiotolerans]|uniref:Uncharacterized protein n=1 Tax=Kineococcus radiotolerans (strain ATCC BAA-149 / DSM 14245 / SRS30216) TaxID=266940 RepID=A6W8Q6_KINRD|nr:hypothetical protein [Kineococcus radiotolerans]ABS03195.1 hypothetical protein Krad_1709 [Kineococcus radiotolerans SRS30216 = ATCC BAA-149]